jgi:hypothetical protein
MAMMGLISTILRAAHVFLDSVNLRNARNRCCATGILTPAAVISNKRAM